MPRTPPAQLRAEFYNQKRFLSLDLCYGRHVDARMYEYLMDNGMTRDEYHWFIGHGERLRQHCIMGTDYYVTNEHRVPIGDRPHRSLR